MMMPTSPQEPLQALATMSSRLPRSGLTCLLTIAGLLVSAPLVDARITRNETATRETPTFGGYSFAGVGQYEKIVGRAFGELDPDDPKNAVIVDIRLAPRNRNGKVEYS